MTSRDQDRPTPAPHHAGGHGEDSGQEQANEQTATTQHPPGHHPAGHHPPGHHAAGHHAAGHHAIGPGGHAATHSGHEVGHGGGHGGHDHGGHGHGSGRGGPAGAVSWGMAAQATLHCLTGCAIGEVLGMVIGTALGWSNAATIVLAVFLAFVFGYALTMRGVLKAGLTLRAAFGVALAADTVSIAVMEVLDNAAMVAIPGAMEAGLADPLFWGALAVAFLLAFIVTTPVNRWMIGRGKGHAVVHQYHH